MKNYILALDQGTTSSRSLIIDSKGTIVAVAQREFPQIFPKPGWVEHDPEAIWKTQQQTARAALKKAKLTWKDIEGIGITNQRETTVIWDRKTGKAIHNAIVWQDRRTAGRCAELRKHPQAKSITKKTGLVIDAYFSGTKAAWILDNVKGARKRAKNGELAFGTIDTWLVWKMTGGRLHITDATNASRTMLFNLRTGKWDSRLAETLKVPRSLLPEICDSSAVYGETDASFLGGPIRIAGIAGDQQAALFGQRAVKPGAAKNTYGTGCFLLLHTGDKPVVSKNKLLTTVACRLNGKLTYALEGSVFVGGAAVQWLRDGLGIIKQSSDVEKLAAGVEDNGGVMFVPALTGLGAPYWDPDARGTMLGLTRGSTAGHVARATLEAIAHQTADVLEAMRSDSGIPLKELRVDGGACRNNALMQFQANMIQARVRRPENSETTAMGAGYLAGLAVGMWTPGDLDRLWKEEHCFKPGRKQTTRLAARAEWKRAVERARGWAQS